ncbi:MAG: mobile mystery protein A [Gemmatimonadetes bacterium]|nr:mobile mystery protein A [Gemmatimonadota bacterium]
MGKLDDLRIHQLDRTLEPFEPLRHRPPPAIGWAKTIREALGISVRQMSRRAGLSRTSITSAEAGETKGTVQFETLRRLADALQCDLVYALVPRTSLAQTLRGQAERKAALLVGGVADSMELEAQGVEGAATQRQVKDLAEQLLRDRGRDFWDV